MPHKWILADLYRSFELFHSPRFDRNVIGWDSGFTPNPIIIILMGPAKNQSDNYKMMPQLLLLLLLLWFPFYKQLGLGQLEMKEFYIPLLGRIKN